MKLRVFHLEQRIQPFPLWDYNVARGVAALFDLVLEAKAG